MKRKEANSIKTKVLIFLSIDPIKVSMFTFISSPTWHRVLAGPAAPPADARGHLEPPEGVHSGLHAQRIRLHGAGPPSAGEPREGLPALSYVSGGIEDFH